MGFILVLLRSRWERCGSGGATETISAGTSYRGNVQITLGGKPTTSDTLTISVHNPSLSGGVKNEVYTVLSTDSMASIGAGLAALINGDAAMKTLGVSVNNGASLAFSESFSGNAIVPSGASSAIATGVDGSSNSKTNTAQVNVQGGTSASLTFDACGNMLSDGTNSFAWDAENRLIKVTYPGSGNNSQFTYDPIGRNVQDRRDDFWKCRFFDFAVRWCGSLEVNSAMYWKLDHRSILLSRRKRLAELATCIVKITSVQSLK